MLSLLAVFKDILPGYRIRLPTEKELEIPVSKEVKQTRDYESMQVRFYQVCPVQTCDALGHTGASMMPINRVFLMLFCS